jgi:hypothetical protein
MAATHSSVTSTHVAIADGIAHITMGELKLTIPIGTIPGLVHLLEYARLSAGGIGAVVGEEVGRGHWRARVPAGEGAAAARSRKRVGDALETWMRENPGWHSEEDLMQVVVDNGMTDANPKRALKIALGKGRESTFDNEGPYWKLKTDADAGPAPKVQRRERGARRRRGGLTRERTGAPPERGPLTEAAAKIRTGARKRLKTRPKLRGEAPASGESSGEAEAGAEVAAPEPARVVRVKKGEDRRLAIRPKPAATEPGTEGAGDHRWTETAAELREKARRNLLGIGSLGGGTSSESPDKA